MGHDRRQGTALARGAGTRGQHRDGAEPRQRCGQIRVNREPPEADGERAWLEGGQGGVGTGMVGAGWVGLRITSRGLVGWGARVGGAGQLHVGWVWAEGGQGVSGRILCGLVR